MFLSDVKTMSSLDVLQVPWGPFVRESMARQGMSSLPPTSSRSYVRVPWEIFVLRRKEREKVLLALKTFEINSVNSTS